MKKKALENEENFIFRNKHWNDLLKINRNKRFRQFFCL